MTAQSVILSSQVRLARNYEDLPFDLSQRPTQAESCVMRTVNALENAGMMGDYDLIRLRDLSENDRQAMAESRLISRDLLRNPETAAVLMRHDRSLSIMVNEDDHLRIQSLREGQELLSAAQTCFQVDDALSRQGKFAFDEHLGYLTACPTNTGTGMRASVLLHLPLLTRGKQMGDVGQLVAKVGLNIRGVYGEGSEALGGVYQLSNQVTLGRTEQELIAAVSAVTSQLCDREWQLRLKGLKNARTELEDAAFRAYGILKNARVLQKAELFQYYSNLRLGASLEVLDVPVSLVDALLEECQDAHLRLYAGEDLTSPQLGRARADRARELLSAH